MAITPTTWVAASASPSLSFSEDGFVYSTSAYSPSAYTRNTALSAISFTSGSWYWEITLNAYPTGTYGKFGVKGGLEEGAFLSGGVGGIGGVFQNDVIGFHFNADAGTMQFYVNGETKRLVSGLTLAPGDSWRAIIKIDSPDGTVVSATANFGRPGFSYTVPAGATSGLGEIPPHNVMSIESDGAGSLAFVPVPTVPGIEALGAGGVSAGGVSLTARPFVTGIRSAGPGVPRSPFDVVVQVLGVSADGSGSPLYFSPPPVPPDIYSVEGIEAEGGGNVGHFSWFATTLTGIEGAGPGNPIATVGCALSGIEAQGVGDARVTVFYRVGPLAAALGAGPVSSLVSVFVPGIESWGAGALRFLGSGVHAVEGIEAPAGGVVSVNATYPVAPLFLAPGAGTPVLRPLPC